MDRGARVIRAIRSGIERARVRGPRETARGALRLVRREVGGAIRRRQLARRPLAVTDAEVAAALGDDARELLRGRVLGALPDLARWDGSVDDSILERADAVAARRFDLLGSGPVDLTGLDWQLDARSGRRWPLVHRSRVPVAFGDGSDIKWPWELSRGQHLPLLAAAYRVTGDRRYLDELGAQLDSWIDGNPVEIGANWLIAMEPAIRAVNWIAALALVAGDAADEPWFRRALGSLLLHGRFIRANLEGGPARGNHYLSDVVGLLVLGTLFSGPEGEAWLNFGVAALNEELEHQVLPDGVNHEMSIPYHRLVTELFVVGDAVLRSLRPDRSLPHGRLQAMLRFTRDVTRPDGLAPLVGDSDDGRILPLDDYGADPRDHRHLFRQARFEPGPAERFAAFRDAGFFVMREGEAYLLVRCGPTGGRGNGWHAHNDQLSFELALGRTPLVIDPGSFTYTADPATRNLFRSTRSHASVLVGGIEQNELSDVELFRLPDRTHARCTRWEPPVFEGVAGVHTRLLELAENDLVIVDTIECERGTEVEWTFPLAGGSASVVDGVVQAEVDGARLGFTGDVEWRVDEGWYAPRYGVRIAVPFVRARKISAGGRDETRVRLRFSR